MQTPMPPTHLSDNPQKLDRQIDRKTLRAEIKLRRENLSKLATTTSRAATR